MPSIRLSKVADQIRDVLAALLPAEVAETRQALVTVSAVTLSPDLRHARVHVSIFPENAPRDSILAAMNRSSGRLKGLLGRSLRLRHVPDLDFRLDRTAEQGERIERLLRDSAGEPASPQPEPGSAPAESGSGEKPD